jgi:hypothetical protein
MEALETQTLSDAMDRNLIRCCRCRSFAATDSEGLCADCFHTRCSECKHPGDLKVEVEERHLYGRQENRSSRS